MRHESSQFSDTGHVHGSLHQSQWLSVVLLNVISQPADGVQAGGLIILCYFFDPPVVQATRLTAPKNNLQFHHTNFHEDFLELEHNYPPLLITAPQRQPMFNLQPFHLRASNIQYYKL
jgi:hypothetical protein